MVRKQRRGSAAAEPLTQARALAPARARALVAGVAVITACLAFVAVGTAQGGPGEREEASALAAQGCPTTVGAEDFWGTKRFRRIAKRMESFGVRTPGSRAHSEFVDWVKRRLKRTGGLQLRKIPIIVKGWEPKRVELKVEGIGDVPIAGPTYYTTPTGRRGASGELVYLPPDEPITDAMAGKIVIRDLSYRSVPIALLRAFSTYAHFWRPSSPELERYWTGGTGGSMWRDLEAAADAGAGGVLFDLGFPRGQMRDHFPHLDPARLRQGVPALNLGADQAAELKRVASRGDARATLRLQAKERATRTQTLVATLPGQSPERVVLDSHTDGIGALQEIGVAGNLALASYFSKLPRRCRPRTLEFAFTTALFYGTLGPEDYAARLDQDYDDGTVALALAMEHLGAVEFEARERAGSKPGRRLVRTSNPEPSAFFVSESEPLTRLVTDRVKARDLRRHIVSHGLRPNPTPPPPLRWLGHGQAYRDRLIPAVHHMNGPWTLLNAGPFGRKALDFAETRKAAMFFGDLVIGSGALSREQLAGDLLDFRSERGKVPPVPRRGEGWRLPPRTGGKAYRALRKYSRLGSDHRSGGAGDRRTARWVARRLRRLGLKTKVEKVRFPRYKPERVSLSSERLDIDPFPVYYSGITGSKGVRGPIVDVGEGSDADFSGQDLDRAIVLASPRGRDRNDVLDRAARAGARAVVLGTNSPGNPAPGNLPRAINVEAEHGLCALPTVIVGDDDWQALSRHAGSTARLVLTAATRRGGGRLPTGTTRNVIAKLPGRSRDAIVVATPLTGWFTAASERGGGVGGLLTVARQLSRLGRPAKTVVFVATGGHELGAIGQKEFIRRHRRLLDRAGAYVNFGSTIAAKEYVEDEGGRLVATGMPNARRGAFAFGSELIEQLAGGAFAAVDRLAFVPGRTIGELSTVTSLGLSVAGVSGNIPYFHTRGDRPGTTSPWLLEPVVKGYKRLLRALLRADHDALRPLGAAPPREDDEPAACPGA